MNEKNDEQWSEEKKKLYKGIDKKQISTRQFRKQKKIEFG